MGYGTASDRKKNSVLARAASQAKRPRKVDPTTCEIDYTPDEQEFMFALDGYKTRTGRRFPTNREVLGVLRSLGYAKPAAEALAAS